MKNFISDTFWLNESVCLPAQRQEIQLHAQRLTEMLEADAEHDVEAALQYLDRSEHIIIFEERPEGNLF